MVLIYEDLERIYGKEGSLSFPSGTHLYGKRNGDLLVKHPSMLLHRHSAGVYILSGVHKILATKGKRSWWPFEHFKHVSKYDDAWVKTERYGTFSVCGSRKLWKWFEYNVMVDI